MISESARPYIDASVPVLREHGLTLTRTFYRNMFASHPELTNLFNMGNQAQGTQQQSLASAVFAYAANIGNPGALAPVVERIAHKHASLGITPDQYSIVGHHLLGAIRETLGEAATPELLEAWAEAYGVLAKVLIEEERKLYQASGTPAGTLRQMRVEAIQPQGELIKSFVLRPVDGAPVADFLPGQYVSVAVDFPDGHRQLRQYSLSDRPGQQTLRISVKKEGDTPAGEVSHWLHSHVKVGDTLQVSQPFGDFHPDVSGAAPIALLSAGVGITPMIAVLNQLAATSPQATVLFAHAAKEKSHRAHDDDLAAARARMPNLTTVLFHENVADPAQEEAGVLAGRMRVDALPRPLLEQAARIYLCGPLGFMQAQRRQLLDAGIPADKLVREVFGPDMLDHLL